MPGRCSLYLTMGRACNAPGSEGETAMTASVETIDADVGTLWSQHLLANRLRETHDDRRSRT